MRRILRENGLSLVLGTMFLLFWIGQSLAGHAEYNAEQESHGEARLSYGAYLSSSHFWEATTENWESEFLQISAFVILTAILFQKGSAESKKLDGSNPSDRDPRKTRPKPDAPWPVRRGGVALWLYERSLAIAFVFLFLVSFVLHVLSGAADYRAEQLTHGGTGPPTLMAYIGTSRFWFESLQNWQSEFLSIAAMVVLSIFLRQKGSPESKPVDSPHSETGE